MLVCVHLTDEHPDPSRYDYQVSLKHQQSQLPQEQEGRPRPSGKSWKLHNSAVHRPQGMKGHSRQACLYLAEGPMPCQNRTIVIEILHSQEKEIS